MLFSNFLFFSFRLSSVYGMDFLFLLMSSKTLNFSQSKCHYSMLYVFFLFPFRFIFFCCCFEHNEKTEKSINSWMKANHKLFFCELLRKFDSKRRNGKKIVFLLLLPNSYIFIRGKYKQFLPQNLFYAFVLLSFVILYWVIFIKEYATTCIGRRCNKTDTVFYVLCVFFIFFKYM